MGAAAKINSRPSVFAYENYRKYLEDMYNYHKAETSRFSFRSFSQNAGFKSPNFLKLLIDGKRDMSLESVRKVIKAFKLSAEEGTFFKNLVFANQAESSRERALHVEQLYRSKEFRKLHPLKPAQFEYYSQWYHIPIREMVASEHFVEDPEWIARRLRGGVTPEQVRQALENLINLGLLRRDANGRLEQAQANVTTGHEVASSAVAAFHREMMRLAADSIDSVDKTKREISASTLLVSEQGLLKLKSLIREFRRTLLEEAENPAHGHAAVVYQLSLTLFPLSEPMDHGDDDGDNS